MHDGRNCGSDERVPQALLSDLDEKLDAALELTFPASDPISLQFDRDSRPDQVEGQPRVPGVDQSGVRPSRRGAGPRAGAKREG